MSGFKGSKFTDRADAAAAAKKAMLEKFRAKPAPDDPAVLARAAERKAIAEAREPVAMARAMRLAVEAGRLAYTAGRMGKRRYADPSSPLAGLI